MLPVVARWAEPTTELTGQASETAGREPQAIRGGRTRAASRRLFAAVGHGPRAAGYSHRRKDAGARRALRRKPIVSRLEIPIDDASDAGPTLVGSQAAAQDLSRTRPARRATPIDAART